MAFKLRKKRLFRFYKAIISGILFGLFYFTSTSSFAGFKEAHNIQSFNLKNGLQVLMIENHNVPLVYHTLWYKVGSADSPEGKSGLAHFLEHLMFKGTEKFPKGSFKDKIASIGGLQNARTSWDTTCFYVIAPKEHLDTVMMMEADRMRNLKLSRADVELEKKVVLQEKQSCALQNPILPVQDAVNAQFFRKHPYGKPVLGTDEDIKRYTLEDALKFYKTWYTPNNAILIIGGDISVSETKAMIEKNYGPLNAQSVPKRERAKEPEHETAKAPLKWNLKELRNVQFQHLYRLPDHQQGDMKFRLSLHLLSQILSNPADGLLQALIEKQDISKMLTSHYVDFYDPLFFVILGEVVNPKKIARIESKVTNLIKTLKRDGVSEKLLMDAKKNLKVAEKYSTDTLENLINFLGEHFMNGHSLKDIDIIHGTLEQVTVQDVNQAINVVFGQKPGLTVYAMPAGR